MVEPVNSSTNLNVVKLLGKGRRLGGEVGEALERLFQTAIGAEGLSRLYQPGFPGVRSFAVEARVAPDQAVEVTFVLVARDGAPVWIGRRAFVQGRTGALEIQHGEEEIATAYRSRNITVDVVQREIDVLTALGSGPATRITTDAEGVASYISALHGFVFADETEEGPPVRSRRANEPNGDRERWLRAAPAVVERFGAKHGWDRGAIEAAIAALREAQAPCALARVSPAGVRRLLAEGDDAELGVTALGRELLTAADMPPWRAALIVSDRTSDARHTGDEYRRRKSQRSEIRNAQELRDARDLLASPKRELRRRALEQLGMIAPPWVAPEVKALAEGKDRKVAVVARQALRQITGVDLADRLLEYAQSTRVDARLRSRAYRVLAEHFKGRLVELVPMMRVDPDARIQRAAIPLIADDPTDAGPNLASLLAANPAFEGKQRTGLTELRLELIERLSRLADPRTLPALMGAFRAEPPPPRAEMLALSRALLAFPDPRAQLALTEVARRLERPAIP